MKSHLFLRESAIENSVWHWIQEIQRDCESVKGGLSLTANENVMSRVVSAMLGLNLQSRYHLGDDSKNPLSPLASKGALLYRKLRGVMTLEAEAREATLKMLNASHVDFRPLSGVHAMISTLVSLSQPGDVVYSFSPEVGGHFATSNILKGIGRSSRFLPWDVEKFDIDLPVLSRDIKERGRPKLVFLDHGMTLFPLNLFELRSLLGPNVIIAYDASHTVGLIFGGEFQRPLLEGCDVLQGNTHKTFPGPQKAIVSFRDKKAGNELSKRMDEGLVSSQHTHHAVALYLTILEMRKYGESYAKQIIKNAKALAEALSRQGFGLISRRGIWTRSHMLLVEKSGGFSIRKACQKLMLAGISSNARPFCGRDVLRLGVQEPTRLGMKEAEMGEIAHLMARLLFKNEKESEIKKEVEALRRSFDSVCFSFDSELTHDFEPADHPMIPVAYHGVIAERECAML